MTWQEAEAAGLLSAREEEHDAVGWRWTTSRDPQPQHGRWWHARRRRRKKHYAVSLTEFADLSDGRRVIVRSDRGFSESWKHSPGPFHGHSTPQSYADYIRDWFKNTEECPCCEFSPEWVIERLQRLYGLEIDPASIRAARQVPLQVELGPHLLEQLPQ